MYESYGVVWENGANLKELWSCGREIAPGERVMELWERNGAMKESYGVVREK